MGDAVRVMARTNAFDSLLVSSPLAVGRRRGVGPCDSRWSVPDCRVGPLAASRAHWYTPTSAARLSWRVSAFILPQTRIPRGKNGPNLEGRSHTLRTQARPPVTPSARREPPNAQRGEDAGPAGIGHRARTRG